MRRLFVAAFGTTAVAAFATIAVAAGYTMSEDEQEVLSAGLTVDPKEGQWAKVPTYDGRDRSYAQEFLSKFELIAKLRKYDAEKQKISFKLSLRSSAYTWLSGLPAATKADFKLLRQAFEYIYTKSI